MANVININYGGTTILNRSDVYMSYLRDARQYKMLPQEEQMKLLQEYATTTDEKRKTQIRNTLIESNQLFIIAAAKQYANGDTNTFLDMISEANLGFVEAIDAYDFTKTKKGIKLMSWAAFYIRRACNSYLLNHGSMIRKSNNRMTHHYLAKATNALAQRLEREPSEEELIDYLANECHLPIKDVRDVRKVNVASVDATVADDDGINPALLEFNETTSNQNACEDEIDRSYASKLVNVAFDALSDRDKEIMKMLYGINDQAVTYSMDTVAEKYNYTKERIRQVHNSALKKMAQKIKAVEHNV